MKSNRLIWIGLVIMTGILVNACKEDFLEVAPRGLLDQGVLATADGVDITLIGAYSMIDGVTNTGLGWEGATSGWVYASIRGMEANKGSFSGDQPLINPIQAYEETSNNQYLNLKWQSCFEGVDRCNNVIIIADRALGNGTITDEQHANFVNQAKVLRGFFHFEAWRLWDGMIPYVDETTDRNAVTNMEDVRQDIIDDLTAGTALPDDMGQIGRFNGTVARVFLAKAYMQMFDDYSSAATLLEDVMLNGTKPNGEPIGLAPTYGEIFDTENRNGIESVYTVQYSINDGSGGYNGGWGESLNFPNGGGPSGCCGFYQPTQEFVNSFRTSGGLPLLDFSYNSDPVVSDDGVGSTDPFTPDAGPLDPRLDWTVGRRAIPYWDWGPHPGASWIRDQAYAGPYAPKKQVFKQSQDPALRDVSGWHQGWSANGYRMIRYADVMLLLAECQAKTGTGDLGLALVNQIRNRAANSAGWVKDDGGNDAANYEIAEYPGFASQQEAIDAVLMERKLELGMEGHRMYDLLRNGDQFVITEINRILDYEKPLRSVLYGDAVFGPEDVSYPIPLRQIELHNGNLVQNR